MLHIFKHTDTHTNYEWTWLFSFLHAIFFQSVLFLFSFYFILFHFVYCDQQTVSLIFGPFEIFHLLQWLVRSPLDYNCVSTAKMVLAHNT